MGYSRAKSMKHFYLAFSNFFFLASSLPKGMTNTGE